MGVTNLWSVLQPTARPTKLETLNRKRLAIDASIWIYQFLKAVRDKEGNALRNSHVVGFFRRICKLLYFGIKPVFVFDGGAPVLKRETIRKRARRREGRREDAVRTAGKLLAVQVERAAEEERERQRQNKVGVEEELPDDQELVYVDELGTGKAERLAQRTAGFKKKDQYHLPELDVDLAQMGGENDPRVMSQKELEEYAKQFHDGEDINLYDFSKIDFDSSFFQSLPPGDKYNILNAARLRSRLRMGYSKEQLDGMFPDRMAFSRFQIERVKERNELTQRLMYVNGMNENDWNSGGRIAGERGREYVLVKNEGVEGGWALGVVSNNKGRKKETAIDLDTEDEQSTGDEAEDEEFEDVAIEGLNRIPKSWKRKRQDWRDADYDMSYEEVAERIAKKRKAVYEGRKRQVEQTLQRAQNETTPKPGLHRIETNTDAEALFVGQEQQDSDENMLFEDVEIQQGRTEPDVAQVQDVEAEEQEDDLQKAIALSLQDPEHDGGFVAEDAVPTAEPTKDDNFDLQAALTESRRSKYKSTTNVRQNPVSPRKRKNGGFSGPLPFESINLGQSLLGKKKIKKTEEAASGGFDRDAGKENKVLPVPDWFNTTINADELKKNRTEEDGGNKSDDHITFGREDVDRRERIRRNDTREVIDLENDDKLETVEQDLYAGEQDNTQTQEEIAERQAELQKQAEEAEAVAEARRKHEEAEREQRYEIARQIAADEEDKPSTTNEVAEEIKAQPPRPTSEPSFVPATADTQAKKKLVSALFGDQSDEDGRSDEVDWSDSDHEDDRVVEPRAFSDQALPEVSSEKVADPEDDDFEDVLPSSPHKPSAALVREPTLDESMFVIDDEDDQPLRHGDHPEEDGQVVKEEFMDHDSDEELMWQLAQEAEEHERFAGSLSSRPVDPVQQRQNYEAELKQLRNQQAKDRRDADEVTQTMIQECQALLRYFGLPYITAPMEAEAQCAHLVSLGLVDGIVTDDSDIFLFGGTRVYKNMFNAAKFVECYLASDLEKEYALDRRKLIRFAHLLGSDYTEGIPGIGPVTALEIISDFPNLNEFKVWAEKVQHSVTQPSVLEAQLTTSFRRKFKNTVLKKLFLPVGFPDARVDAAYLEPEVDDAREEFQWGVPDLPALRSYLMSTIGWSQERMDEILVPVVRDMNQREVEGVQSNITRFFSGGVGVGASTVGRGQGGSNGVEGTAPRNRTGKESGRMKHAYTRLRAEAAKKRNARSEADHEEDLAGLEEMNAHANGDTNQQQDDTVSESAVRPSGVNGATKKRRKKKQQQQQQQVQDEGEDEDDFT